MYDCMAFRSAVQDVSIVELSSSYGTARMRTQCIVCHWCVCLQVANIDYDTHLGRIAVGRVVNGTIKKGQQVSICSTLEPGTRTAKVGADSSTTEQQLGQLGACCRYIVL
jgi:hypothetical protein